MSKRPMLTRIRDAIRARRLLMFGYGDSTTRTNRQVSAIHCRLDDAATPADAGAA